MIWALLFSIIFGSESVFIIPKMEKYVKKHIDDKKLVEEFKSVRKETKKIKKAFRKFNTKKVKEIRKLNATTTATAEEFLSLGNEIMTAREEIQQKEIKDLVKMKSYISKEKWDLIIAEAKKDIIKYNKKNKKKVRSLEKSVEKSERTIRKKLPRNVETEVFYLQLTEYTEQLLLSVKEFYNYSESDNIILSFDAGNEELKELKDNINQYRKDIYQEYIETHFALIEVTTEQEYRSIMKQLNKLF